MRILALVMSVALLGCAAEQTEVAASNAECQVGATRVCSCDGGSGT